MKHLDPSMSVKRKVTVPVGRLGKGGLHRARIDRLPYLATFGGGRFRSSDAGPAIRAPDEVEGSRGRWLESDGLLWNFRRSVQRLDWMRWGPTIGHRRGDLRVDHGDIGLDPLDELV